MHSILEKLCNTLNGIVAKSLAACYAANAPSNNTWRIHWRIDMKEYIVVLYVVEDDFHGAEVNVMLMAVDEKNAKHQAITEYPWADEVLGAIQLPEF